MKFIRLIYIPMVLLQLYGCGNKPSRQETKMKEESKKGRVYIQDVSKYEPSFIEGISAYNDTLTIIGNFVVTGSDTVYFPEELPLDKEMTFEGRRNGKVYELIVRRKNLTTLDYRFSLMYEKGPQLISKDGKAILNDMFFLAAEVDEDDMTGDAYGSYEYRDVDSDCQLVIKIGEKDEDGRPRATIAYACKDKSKDVPDSPTLRAK